VESPTVQASAYFTFGPFQFAGGMVWALTAVIPLQHIELNAATSLAAWLSSSRSKTAKSKTVEHFRGQPACHVIMDGLGILR
jgi:hypothetical protein